MRLVSGAQDRVNAAPGARQAGANDQGTAAGFVGADLSFVRPACDRRGRAIRAPSRFWEKVGPKCAHNPIVRSLLVAGRTQERSAPTQLHVPCLSDGLPRIVLVECPSMFVVFFLRKRFKPYPGF